MKIHTISSSLSKNSIYWTISLNLINFIRSIRRETPVVEKEVEENDVPKVVEAEEKSVENGKSEEDVAAVPTKNGEVPAVEEDEDESKDGEEEKNGDSTGKHCKKLPQNIK